MLRFLVPCAFIALGATSSEHTERRFALINACLADRALSPMASPGSRAARWAGHRWAPGWDGVPARVAVEESQVAHRVAESRAGLGCATAPDRDWPDSMDCLDQFADFGFCIVMRLLFSLLEANSFRSDQSGFLLITESRRQLVKTMR